MKVFYNRSFLLGLFLLIGFGLTAQTSGGPDAFGYTWKNSMDPDGPTLNWIDITGIGTEVSGLTDDNSAPGFFDMGIDFHFYWLTYNQVKLGSNGWISFNNVSNISSCFPNIPNSSAQGQGNNLVCPMLTDLNFETAGVNAGNPAKMYTATIADQFIVSYHNVPFWTNNGAGNPSYMGDNTFQVIFNAADSSITFQYLQMDATSTGGCALPDVNAITGIENVSGQVGLAVTDPGAMPMSNSAVKFYYPETVTFEVADVTPSWAINSANGGSFHMPGSSIAISAEVANTGNADVEDTFVVEAKIKSNTFPLNGYQETATVGPIALGESAVATFADFSNFTFTPGPLPPDTYTLTTTTTLAGDLVIGNNETLTEIVVVDTAGVDEVELSYATLAVPDDGIAWSNGGGNSGMGVYYEPPYYPFTINAVSIFVASNGGTDDAYSVQIFEDDNVTPGLPGTLINIESVPASSYDAAGSWVRSDFAFPTTITEGGFYVGWIMEGNNTVCGTESATPRSRRALEFIGGGWAEFRQNTEREVAMRVHGAPPPVASDINEIDFANNVRVFPNPTHHKLNIQSTLSDETIERVQLFNTLGEMVLDRKTDIRPNQVFTLNLSDLAGGVYILNLTADGTTISQKVSIAR